MESGETFTGEQERSESVTADNRQTLGKTSKLIRRNFVSWEVFQDVWMTRGIYCTVQDQHGPFRDDIIALNLDKHLKNLFIFMQNCTRKHRNKHELDSCYRGSVCSV